MSWGSSSSWGSGGGGGSGFGSSWGSGGAGSKSSGSGWGTGSSGGGDSWGASKESSSGWGSGAASKGADSWGAPSTGGWGASSGTSSGGWGAAGSSGTPQVGSKGFRFQPAVETVTDPKSHRKSELHYQSICMHKSFIGKSPEELRFEDLFGKPASKQSSAADNSWGSKPSSSSSGWGAPASTGGWGANTSGTSSGSSSGWGSSSGQSSAGGWGASSSKESGFGSGWGASGTSSGSGSSGWGASTDKKKDSGWGSAAPSASSGWGSSATSGGWGASSDSKKDSGWGAQSSTGGWGASSGSGGWGADSSSTTGSGASTGWGSSSGTSSSTSSGWGAASGSGWGAPSDKKKTSSGGWGANGWGADSSKKDSSSSGWGSTASSSGWGAESSKKDSGWGSTASSWGGGDSKKSSSAGGWGDWGSSSKKETASSWGSGSVSGWGVASDKKKDSGSWGDWGAASGKKQQARDDSPPLFAAHNLNPYQIDLTLGLKALSDPKKRAQLTKGATTGGVSRIRGALTPAKTPMGKTPRRNLAQWSVASGTVGSAASGRPSVVRLTPRSVANSRRRVPLTVSRTLATRRRTPALGVSGIGGALVKAPTDTRASEIGRTLSAIMSTPGAHLSTVARSCRGLTAAKTITATPLNASQLSDFQNIRIEVKPLKFPPLTAKKESSSSKVSPMKEGKMERTYSNPIPVLTKAQYYTVPSMAELCSLTDEELSRVRNFTVGHVEFGECMWPALTDVRGLNVDELVTFRKHAVEVYDDDCGDKPPQGCGLNKRTHVSLFGFWPPAFDEDGNERDATGDEARKYANQMATSIESANDGITFDSYSLADGELKFTVEHWTVYGILQTPSLRVAKLQRITDAKESMALPTDC